MTHKCQKVLKISKKKSVKRGGGGQSIITTIHTRQEIQCFAVCGILKNLHI